MICTHRPIFYQVYISKDISKFMFINKKYPQKIKIVPFKYLPEEGLQLIYISQDYYDKNAISEGEILMLLDENYEENIKAIDFLRGLNKKCELCFFEYFKKHNLQIK